MEETFKMIIAEVEKFNQSIIDTLDGKDITNTGTAKKSLKVEFGNDFVRSLGIFYLEFLDTGRGSGKFPNIEKIKKWVVTKKGITDEKKANQVAFLVARKIAKLGTQIFRDNSKGIELTTKVDALRMSIRSQLGETAKADITQKLDKFKNRYKFSL